MNIKPLASIIADSMNTETGNRLTTFQVRTPTVLWAEILTHRAFSRSAASARAMPSVTYRNYLADDPFIPWHWGKNCKGMQSHEPLPEEEITKAKVVMQRHLQQSLEAHKELEALGIHKQICNRVLAVYAWTDAVITATEWNNFYRLRDHPAAEPHIRDIAAWMNELYQSNTPAELISGEWHLPYTTEEERKDLEKAKVHSAARCARASYLRLGEPSTYEQDLKTSNMLLPKGEPPHASPFEHQALALLQPMEFGNFTGWMQARKFIPFESGRNNPQPTQPPQPSTKER